MKKTLNQKGTTLIIILILVSSIGQLANTFTSNKQSDKILKLEKKVQDLEKSDKENAQIIEELSNKLIENNKDISTIFRMYQKVN